MSSRVGWVEERNPTSTIVRNCKIIERAEPLLGAVPLEETDWHISPPEKKLVSSPRSPETPLLPLC